MNLAPAPSRLAPVFVERIWGARNLAPLFQNAPQTKDPIGEVWLTGDRCAFASGPLAGRTLGEAWPTLPPEWTGTTVRSAPRIPLLVKFIFPEDWLSVQVHPNDEYAGRHEAAAGGVGKTEMWYAVAARENSELFLGLAPGTTAESFHRAIEDGTVERCLTRVSVREGDAFFVPAGSVHAIGPGTILCEVQQHSDITYRVFDYNRKQADGSLRQLHVHQAMDVTNFGPQRGRRVNPVQLDRGPLCEKSLAACRYFATDRWEFSAPVAAETSPERFELLIPLAGAGRIEWGIDSAAYGPAEVWFLPAALGAYRLVPAAATKLLRTYVPDLQKLEQRFAASGIERDVWSRVIHT